MLFYQIGWFLMFFWYLCEFCKKNYAQCKNNEKIVLFLWHQQQLFTFYITTQTFIYEEKFTLSHRLG